MAFPELNGAPTWSTTVFAGIFSFWNQNSMLVENAFVQNWLAFEDPDQPGVLMYSTCNVGYGNSEDVTVNNYFAEEGQPTPEWGNSAWDSVNATYWDNTDTVWGFFQDELDP